MKFFLQAEYKNLGFNFNNSLDCQKHLQGIASSLSWVKAKSKLTMASMSLKVKAKLWNDYLYYRLRYQRPPSGYIQDDRKSTEKISPITKVGGTLYQIILIKVQENKRQIGQTPEMFDALSEAVILTILKFFSIG